MCQAEQGRGEGAMVTHIPKYGQAFLQERTSGNKVALHVGESACCPQRFGPLRSSFGRSRPGHRFLEPHAAFLKITSHEPKPGQCRREAQARFDSLRVPLAPSE